MSVRGQDRQIDNIEFNVGDIHRSKAFYGAVFGWTFVDYGPTYTEFSDGRLTGGFTTGEPVRPGGPLVILFANDLEGAHQRITAAGAVISRETFAFMRPASQPPRHAQTEHAGVANRRWSVAAEAVFASDIRHVVGHRTHLFLAQLMAPDQCAAGLVS